MKKKLKLICIFIISWFLIHEIAIITDGLNDEISQSNFVVILGNKVNKDGTLSDRLKSRLDKGLELYNDSIVKNIYVTGGLGEEGFYEGTKMAEYLLSQGVSSSHIYSDNKGNNTKLSAGNFINDHPKSVSVIVVTQFYHITRTKLAFRKIGIEKVYAAHSNFYEWRDIYSLIREFFAYYKYLLFY